MTNTKLAILETINGVIAGNYIDIISTTKAIKDEVIFDYEMDKVENTITLFADGEDYGICYICQIKEKQKEKQMENTKGKQMKTTTIKPTETITNIKGAMIETLVALENSEFSSKDLFNQNRDYLSSVIDINVGIKALKSLVVEVTENYTSHYKNKLNTIVSYSVIACNSKLSIDTNILFWYNVEKALKLVEHISINFTEDLGKIRNLLNSLKGKSISKLTSRPDKNKYNELYSAKLVELYKEYKLDEDDDKKSVKIETLFNTLSLESKNAMIAKLQKLLK